MSDPDISLIVPLHGVERYLPEFLASLSAQRTFDGSWEVLFIDDGSPDASASIVSDWLASARVRGILVRQANAGVSAARNAGLDRARGTWVTFPDPDDVLDDGYLRGAWEVIRARGREVSFVVTRVLRLDEADGVIRDRHPLRFRFTGGDRVVDMAERPDFFQLQVTTSFFRRQDLVATGARFPGGVAASEDALFTATFLLRHGTARMGIARRAVYLYRKRAAGDSAVDGYHRSRAAYVDRFADGYLPLLHEAAARGPVPGWLQSMLLYEAQWILPGITAPLARRPQLSAEDDAAALGAWTACARFLSDDRILAYDATALPVEVRFALLALRGSPLPGWERELCESIPGGRRTRRYLIGSPGGDHTADSPEIRDRQVVLFGRTELVERIAWYVGPASADDGPPRGASVVRRREVERRDAYGQVRLAVIPREGDVSVVRVRTSLGAHPLAWTREAATVLWRRARRSVVSGAFLVHLAARAGFGRRFRRTWVVAEPERSQARALVEALRAQGVASVVLGGSSGALGRGSLAHRLALEQCRGVIGPDPLDIARVRRRLYRPNGPLWIMTARRELEPDALRALVGADPVLVVAETASAAASLADPVSPGLLVRDRILTVSADSVPAGSLADAVARAVVRVDDASGTARATRPPR
ncbi:glycosyltransferase [Microbacterium sp.]|uniref:glycosyltransferase family 2 protein n=1 Tax=Microbacterium sp. TaxID=51671 RepID=UPI00092C32B7|nr:glycosyltransferase [Microbacterium sp.]MBN9192801.1 glycosyltransferase [Microbacterium sp.]OJU70783.1 MAG: hypothetical protein BGO04_10035 [Microbacterium sp. 70-38]